MSPPMSSRIYSLAWKHAASMEKRKAHAVRNHARRQKAKSLLKKTDAVLRLKSRQSRVNGITAKFPKFLAMSCMFTYLTVLTPRETAPSPKPSLHIPLIMI